MKNYVQVESVRLSVMRDIEDRIKYECGDTTGFIKEEDKPGRREAYEYLIEVIANAKIPVR